MTSRTCPLWLSLAIVTGCRSTPDEPSPTVLFDFTADYANPQFLREKVRVEFDHDTRAALVSGWSDSEVATDGVTFTWANASIAELDVFLLHTNYASLRIRCDPFAHPTLPPQHLTVAINGRQLEKRVLSPGFHVVDIPIPRDVLLPGSNRIAFSFNWIVAPASVAKTNDDRRKLAAAFDYLSLIPRQVVAGSQPAKAAEVDKRGVITPPGTGVVYRLTIPTNASVEFGSEHKQLTVPALGGELWIREVGAASTLVIPSNQDPKGRSHTSLEQMANRFVELAFVNRERPGVGNLIWMAPKVVRPKRRSKPLRNLILIVVDTLRADYLRSYGAEIATPNTDRLAASGTLFETTYSHIPETVPSHATLFTSLLPFDHGVHSNGQILHEDQQTLAEQMDLFGFRTAAFVSLGVLKREFGIAQGFQEYVDDFPIEPFLDASQINGKVIEWLEKAGAEPFFLWVHYSDPHEPYTAPDLEYPAIAIDLKGHGVGVIHADGRRFSIPVDLAHGENILEFHSGDEIGRGLVFDTLQFNDDAVKLSFRKGWWTSPRYRAGSQLTSLPAVAVAHNSEDSVRKARLVGSVSRLMNKEQTLYHYRREVEFVDGKIGELIAALDNRGLRENSLIVLTSDHGEGLGDHDLWGHVDQLYDTLLRVPLIFTAPGVVREGARISTPAGLVDFLPTVLDVFELPHTLHSRGQSLLPEMAITGRAHPVMPKEPRPTAVEKTPCANLCQLGGVPKRPFTAETFFVPYGARKDRKAVMINGCKLIIERGWREDWHYELYDLTRDPKEQQNRAAECPQTTSALYQLIWRNLAAQGRTTTASQKRPITDETEEMLRSLGYIP